ncbi:MAG: class I adenylate-forming enzyme family protein [Bdellovibrionales bacterium]
MDPLRDWSGAKSNSSVAMFASYGAKLTENFEKFAQAEAIVEVPAHGPVLRRTYQQFAEDVENVRKLLRAHGQAPVVATIAGNTYPHLLWISATWLEGRTLCPLNPDEGIERLKLRLGQLQQPVSLWFDRGAPVDVETLGALPMRWQSNTTSPLQPACVRDSNRPMTLIFTSGSTGYAKIVEQMEEQVLANAQALVQHHGLDDRTVIATPLPIFHVNALNFSFVCSQLTGGKLVLFEKFHPHQLSEMLAQERVHICSVVPHILQTLLERLQTLKSESWDELRYFVTAASALSPQLAKDLVARFPKRVVQGYGLSEAVNFSCLNPIDLNAQDYAKWMTQYERPSIGVPVWGNEVLIFDECGMSLGVGEKGEVVIRGQIVMRGYQGDTGRQVFEGSVLHTGDVGFYQEDETGRRFVFICGRLKDTAKRLGQTVSLVEIDDLLSGWSEWGTKAVAVAFDHQVAGEELAVLVQAEPHQTVPLHELKQLLEKKCPDYMRPRLIGVTTQAVRTASGKPIRWKLKPLLAKFHDQMFGPKIIDMGRLD